ncbi:MAG: DNA adenine methylase [Sulfurospirillum cavolei]|nr:DNA adenine methylase [Sulfurospirillum cavolei]
MNYIGSKKTILDFISESIHQVVGEQPLEFCDLFAGTGCVGAYFKKQGYKIISNDLQHYSYVINRHLIQNHLEMPFNSLLDIVPNLLSTPINERKNLVCDYLTQIEGIEGFIFKNYSPASIRYSEYKRMYFTEENAKKCDAIRKKIEDWYQNNLIDENEYYFLASSLINSADKYANVLSVYGAFLKKFRKKALEPFKLIPTELIINDQEHKVYNMDSNELIEQIESDILYLDPPYNNRHYATNYHLLETISKYDTPKIYGKTGLREYTHQKSLYCYEEHAKNSLEELINKSKSKYIFVSYSNEGIISAQDIKSMLEHKGKYGVFKMQHTRYRTDSKRTYKANYTIESLHYCICK